MEVKDEILDEFKFIGNWIADETHKRKYDEKELEQLSKKLIKIKKYLSE